jgi:C4-dicarboxylate-specific signal transduction histidine kinase
MPKNRYEMAEIIITHLLDINAGKCTITDETIINEEDQSMQVILTGLMYLYEDLRLKERQQKEAEGEMMRTLDSLKDAQDASLNIMDDMERKKKEVIELNITLKKRVNEEVAKSREKDQLLIQQSRLAAMGEMLSNIAHQWRQPLNTTGLIFQNIRDAYNYGELNKEYLDNTVDNAMKIVQNMSKTIDDFKNFFRSDKEKQQFDLKKSIGRALSLVYADFESSGIPVELEAAEEITVTGYPNEYLQVILNILNNARDILTERKIENPRIEIRIFKENEIGVVTVMDNAGGIPEDIIERVFDPYFTTKEMGTGIGLYMSKMIIEKNMGGRLTVKNVDSGAEFRIEIPYTERIRMKYNKDLILLGKQE